MVLVSDKMRDESPSHQRMQHAVSARPRSGTKGAALFEMAFMLPVLIIMFVGMIEFGNFILVRERINKVTNQLSSVLYNIRFEEVNDGTAIQAIIDQAQRIARPLADPTVTVRFCEWHAGRLYRIYREHRSGSGDNACGEEGPQCGIDATQEGYGSFVQVFSCANYRPLILWPFFAVFNQDITVRNLSYLPLTTRQIEPRIMALSNEGVRIPESASCRSDPALCGAPQQDEEDDPCKDIPNTENIDGSCKTVCDTGYRRDGSGQCDCPAAKSADGNGGCMCPNGQDWVNESCVLRCNPACQTRDPDTQACVPIPGQSC